MIDVKDRVPARVLENGAIRYEEFDADGNSLGYKYIKRADEPTEVGTPINKMLFKNTQAYIQSVDRYIEPLLKASTEQTSIYFEDIIPKTWTTDDNYLVNGDIKITASEFKNNGGNIGKVFDGSTETSYNPNTNDFSVIIDFAAPQSIKKFGVTHSNKNNKLTISGSNDNSNWTTLAGPGYNHDGKHDSIISIEDSNMYRYYKFRWYYGYNSSYYIYEIKVLEYEKASQVLEISYPLDAYDANKIIKLKTPSNISTASKPHININNLGEKIISDNLKPNRLYTLVYNGSNYCTVGRYISEVVNYKNDTNITGTANLTISDVELEEGKIYTLYIFNRPSSLVTSSEATMSISIAGKSIYTGSTHYNGFAKLDFVMLNGYLYAVGKVLLSDGTITDVKTVVAYEKKDSYSISYTAYAGSTSSVSIGKDAFIKLMKVEGDVYNETGTV